MYTAFSHKARKASSDMYEPHLVNNANDHAHDDDGPTTNILDELDKIAPIKSFDAFPKVRGLVGRAQTRSNRRILANLNGEGC